jgi:hypothetical protein
MSRPGDEAEEEGGSRGHEEQRAKRELPRNHTPGTWFIDDNCQERGKYGEKPNRNKNAFLSDDKSQKRWQAADSLDVAVSEHIGAKIEGQRVRRARSIEGDTQSADCVSRGEIHARSGDPDVVSGPIAADPDDKQDGYQEAEECRRGDSPLGAHAINLADERSSVRVRIRGLEKFAPCFRIERIAAH